MENTKQFPMKKMMIIMLLPVVLCTWAVAQPGMNGGHNVLTAEEEAAGWKLLFDGHSSTGWRSIGQDQFPEKGWEVREGELRAGHSGDSESGGGGDIITEEQYGQFELVFEWKMLTKGGNSGVKYLVNESLTTTGRSGLGLEYQILDDDNHPWMLEGKMSPNDYHTMGALYEFFPPSGKKKVVHPLGEWNISRIVSKGHLVEHWLNGALLVSYKRGGKKFMEKLNQSKFKDVKNFGMEEQGHILIQDHGSQMHFRNIKIREF
jgi:hypothetical protein